jgi:Zn finger protein HypA/HybF involved in hydrogenase expression
LKGIENETVPQVKDIWLEHFLEKIKCPKCDNNLKHLDDQILCEKCGYKNSF